MHSNNQKINNNNTNRLHKIVNSNSTNQVVNNFKKSILYDLSGSLNEGAVIRNVPKFRMNTRDFELLASAKHKEIRQSQVIVRVLSPSNSRRPSAITSGLSASTTNSKKPKQYLSALLTPINAYSVYSECKSDF
jgi:hypothetical protein